MSSTLSALESVLTRLSLTDEASLPKALSTYLVPVLDALEQSDAAVRAKVLEVLTHIKRRVQGRPMELPLEALVKAMQEAKDALHRDMLWVYVDMALQRAELDVKCRTLAVLFSHLPGFQPRLKSTILGRFLQILPQIPLERVSSEKLGWTWETTFSPEFQSAFLRTAVAVLLWPQNGESPASLPGLDDAFVATLAQCVPWSSLSLSAVKSRLVLLPWAPSALALIAALYPSSSPPGNATIGDIGGDAEVWALTQPLALKTAPATRVSILRVIQKSPLALGSYPAILPIVFGAFVPTEPALLHEAGAALVAVLSPPPAIAGLIMNTMLKTSLTPMLCVAIERLLSISPTIATKDARLLNALASALTADADSRLATAARASVEAISNILKDNFPPEPLRDEMWSIIERLAAIGTSEASLASLSLLTLWPYHFAPARRIALTLTTEPSPVRAPAEQAVLNVPLDRSAWPSLSAWVAALPPTEAIMESHLNYSRTILHVRPSEAALDLARRCVDLLTSPPNLARAAVALLCVAHAKYPALVGPVCRDNFDSLYKHLALRQPQELSLDLARLLAAVDRTQLRTRIMTIFTTLPRNLGEPAVIGSLRALGALVENPVDDSEHGAAVDLLEKLLQVKDAPLGLLCEVLMLCLNQPIPEARASTLTELLVGLTDNASEDALQSLVTSFSRIAPPSLYASLREKLLVIALNGPVHSDVPRACGVALSKVCDTAGAREVVIRLLKALLVRPRVRALKALRALLEPPTPVAPFLVALAPTLQRHCVNILHGDTKKNKEEKEKKDEKEDKESKTKKENQDEPEEMETYLAAQILHLVFEGLGRKVDLALSLVKGLRGEDRSESTDFPEAPENTRVGPFTLLADLAVKLEDPNLLYDMLALATDSSANNSVEIEEAIEGEVSTDQLAIAPLTASEWGGLWKEANSAILSLQGPITIQMPVAPSPLRAAAAASWNTFLPPLWRSLHLPPPYGRLLRRLFNALTPPSQQPRLLHAHLKILVADLTENMWSTSALERESSCLAVADLVRAAPSGPLAPLLMVLWPRLLRPLDDGRARVRAAALAAAQALSAATIRVCEAEGAAVTPLLPLLAASLASPVKEVRFVTGALMLELLRILDKHIVPHVAVLVPALLSAIAAHEPEEVAALAPHAERLGLTAALDQARFANARASPLTAALDTCLSHVDSSTVLDVALALCDPLESPHVLLRSGALRVVQTLARPPSPLTGVTKASTALLSRVTKTLSSSSTVLVSIAAEAGAALALVVGPKRLRSYVEACIKLPPPALARSLLYLVRSLPSNRLAALNAIIVPAIYALRFHEKVDNLADEVWGELGASLANHAEAVVTHLGERLSAPVYEERVMGAKALVDFVRSLSPELVRSYSGQLVGPLCAALRGRLWAGKAHLVRALRALLVVGVDSSADVEGAIKILGDQVRRGSGCYARTVLRSLLRILEKLMATFPTISYRSLVAEPLIPALELCAKGEVPQDEDEAESGKKPESEEESTGSASSVYTVLVCNVVSAAWQKNGDEELRMRGASSLVQIVKTPSRNTAKPAMRALVTLLPPIPPPETASVICALAHADRDVSALVEAVSALSGDAKARILEQACDHATCSSQWDQIRDQ